MNKLFLLVAMTVLFMPSYHINAAQSPPIVCFWDDLEHRSCDDPLEFGYPVIGDSWKSMGYGYPFDHLVVCGPISTLGEKSIHAIRDLNNDILFQFQAMPRPYFYYQKGMTGVFEQAVYIPSGSGASMEIRAGTLAVAASLTCNNIQTTWRCRTSGGINFDSGVPVEYDRWLNTRIELYDDMTYSAWVGPVGESETQLCSNLAWGDGISLGAPLKVVLGYSLPDPSDRYYDNIKTYWIDNNAQGYPPISQLLNPIIVDGNVDIVNEWAGMKKVASKPSNDLGNFRGYIHVGDALASSTEVSAYVAYDVNELNGVPDPNSSFFYIGGTVTNAIYGQPEIENNSFFEAVFTYDLPGSVNDVSYRFACFATGFDPDQDPNSSGLEYNGRLVGSGTYRPLSRPSWDETWSDANDFLGRGGEKWYTVSNGVMHVEMKIPFGTMPEFTGPEPGKLVNVQFNVRDDTGRSTTNLAQELYPWWTYPGQISGPAVGIAFPVCGDENHEYPLGDFNQDCRVDVDDLNFFIQHWLEDTRP